MEVSVEVRVKDTTDVYYNGVKIYNAFSSGTFNLPVFSSTTILGFDVKNSQSNGFINVLLTYKKDGNIIKSTTDTSIWKATSASNTANTDWSSPDSTFSGWTASVLTNCQLTQQRPSFWVNSACSGNRAWFKTDISSNLFFFSFLFFLSFFFFFVFLTYIHKKKKILVLHVKQESP